MILDSVGLSLGIPSIKTQLAGVSGVGPLEWKVQCGTVRSKNGTVEASMRQRVNCQLLPRAWSFFFWANHHSPLLRNRVHLQNGNKSCLGLPVGWAGIINQTIQRLDRGPQSLAVSPSFVSFCFCCPDLGNTHTLFHFTECRVISPCSYMSCISITSNPQQLNPWNDPLLRPKWRRYVSRGQTCHQYRGDTSSPAVYPPSNTIPGLGLKRL